jgi:hypothetical protein
MPVCICFRVRGAASFDCRLDLCDVRVFCAQSTLIFPGISCLVFEDLIVDRYFVRGTIVSFHDMDCRPT